MISWLEYYFVEYVQNVVNYHIIILMTRNGLKI